MIDRREFIKQMGMVTGAAMIATAPWLKVFSDSKNTKNEVARIAVIGPGSRGQYLLDLLVRNPKVKIVALCDNYAPNLELARQKVPDAKTFTDYRKVLESTEVDAVVIATPPLMHTPIALDAFSAGKHVFVEKAVALELDETLDIYNAYRNTGNIFFVGQQRFFDPRYIAAMSLIHSGEFGNIQSIRLNWDRNTDWRRPIPSPELDKQINWRLYKASSKGLMTELACHQLQIGTWALRSIPDRVMGVGSLVARAHEREVYDNVSCIYTFDNGVKMTYESTNSNKFYGLEERILCEKGTLEPERGKYYYEDIAPAPGILQLLNDVENSIFETIPIAGSSWVPELASKNEGEWLLKKKNEGDGTRELLEAFAEAVITGKQPENFAEESYYGTQLCLLGHQAMEEDRPLVYPEKYKLNYLNHKKS
jgi:predicted dehydrogenase